MLKPGVIPLLCHRPGDLRPGAVPVAGSVPVRCVGCGCRVMASPVSRRMIGDGKVQPVCPACLPGGPVMLIGITAEQLAEARAALATPPEAN